MIILTYIINLLVIFILLVAAYFCVFLLKNIAAEIKTKRKIYEDLKLLVSKTTTAKDEELRKNYKNDKKALKIIEKAVYEKTNMVRLYSISKNAELGIKKVKRMDRREQIVTQLEYKRAVRTGEMESLDAKIIEFPAETSPQTRDTQG